METELEPNIVMQAVRANMTLLFLLHLRSLAIRHTLAFLHMEEARRLLEGNDGD